MGEGVATGDIEDGRERRTPGARVHTDGHIQAGCLLIHWEKVGIVQGAVALNAPEEEPNGAMLFGKVALFNRCVDRSEGWHHYPPEAALCLLPDPGHEAVVRATQRHLQLDVIGNVGQKQGRVDYLCGDPHQVHGLESPWDVQQFSGPHVRHGLELAWLRRRPQQEPAFTGGLGKDVAIDEPEARAPIDRILRPRDDDGTAWVHLLVYKIPDLR